MSRLQRPGPERADEVATTTGSTGGREEEGVVRRDTGPERFPMTNPLDRTHLPGGLSRPGSLLVRPL
ncbi:protein of unknown function [Kyrpidia spormannii]|uniref:Uncharacterized protein n=2 Tax=Kyrpidia spormannii TaxID=2055160 RepID=A0ACA8Z846_9BACL|nr:protein of unknown function [Kyrpidia spormannii]CAB3391705.1 protein of unknown function [Kyrpidia spormannii]